MIRDSTKMYCAVRLQLDEGASHERLDIASLCKSREAARISSEIDTEARELWTKDSPVLRIARVEIQEIEEG